MGDHEWDVPIEGHRLIELVLEHVQAVHTIGLRIFRAIYPAADCGLEGERRGVLWQAVDNRRRGEREVNAHRLEGETGRVTWSKRKSGFGQRNAKESGD